MQIILIIQYKQYGPYIDVELRDTGTPHEFSTVIRRVFGSVEVQLLFDVLKDRNLALINKKDDNDIIRKVSELIIQGHEIKTDIRYPKPQQHTFGD